MQRRAEEIDAPVDVGSEPRRILSRLSGALRRSARWLSSHLQERQQSGSRLLLAVSLALIFVTAVGVRLLHQQDRNAAGSEAGSEMSVIARLYDREARRMLEERRILFPRIPVDPGDARMIVHPPGYPIFIAGIYAAFQDSASAVILAQIILDALSAVVVFLIAAEVFNRTIALIAGLLIALSPHFAHSSLWFSPDTLPILPILLAVFLIIKASKHPRFINILGAGALLGVSCWLRANGLLVTVFLAGAIWMLFDRRRRVRFAAALIGSAVLVISPITIRNWLLYHRFVPLSVDGGLAMVEGIAEYDTSGRFGMPRFDGEALAKDLEWHDRSEYGGNLWSPDGIERDNYRFRRGLDVIRSHPAWFVGVMARRAIFMLRYDQPRGAVWPFTTAACPRISSEPAFDHDVALKDLAQTSWSSTSSDLFADGVVLGFNTQVTRIVQRDSLCVIGDGSEYGDQFQSASIRVEPRSDYLLSLSANAVSGSTAVKVMTADRRITLASALLSERKRKSEAGHARGAVDEHSIPGNLALEIELPFATGDHREVSLVVSNNGSSQSPPVLEIKDGRLYELGRTPHQWTRFVRPLARGLQRNLYATSPMLMLVVVGVTLLLLAGRWRAVLTLMIVPAYYLLVHSAVHTEYRYILAIHYFLFVFAAVTFYCVGILAKQSVAQQWARLSRHRRQVTVMQP